MMSGFPARTVVGILAALVGFQGAAEAGGRHNPRQHQGRDVEHGRGQYDAIRQGLWPQNLPYTRQGHWGLDHRFPKYPLFHGPIPAGPGDPLHETGLFPWQRG